MNKQVLWMVILMSCMPLITWSRDGSLGKRRHSGRDDVDYYYRQRHREVAERAEQMLAMLAAEALAAQNRTNIAGNVIDPDDEGHTDSEQSIDQQSISHVGTVAQIMDLIDPPASENVQGDNVDWRVNPIPEEMHAQSEATLARVRARRQNEMERAMAEVYGGVDVIDSDDEGHTDFEQNGDHQSVSQVGTVAQIMDLIDPPASENVQGDNVDWRVNPIPEEMHAQSEATLARVRARRQNEMERAIAEVYGGVDAPIYTDRPESTLTIDGQNNQNN